MSTSFWNISQPGSSEHFPKSWSYDAEMAFMGQRSIYYKSDGTKLDNCKGCIAKMASRGLRNARKKLFYKGRKKGGHRRLLSANEIGVRGSGKKRQKLRRKDYSFKDEYMRKGTSNLPNRLPERMMDQKVIGGEVDLVPVQTNHLMQKIQILLNQNPKWTRVIMRNPVMIWT